MAVASSAHTAFKIMILKKRLLFMTGVLTTLVRMGNTPIFNGINGYISKQIRVNLMLRIGLTGVRMLVDGI